MWFFIHLFYTFVYLFSILNGQNQSQTYYLRLFILIPSDGCLSPNGLFDFIASIRESIDLSTQTLNWALKSNIEQNLIPLSESQELAKITKSNSIYYNVIVGPYDPGLCGQMNQIVLIPYLDCMKPRSTFVYHINFQCPFRQITYQSQLLPSTTPYCYNTSQYYEDFTNVGSLYVGANKYQITTALTKILRHLNRLNIVLIYQDDDHVTDASGIFANYVAYLLIQRKEFGISVKEINGWHLGKDVSNVFPVGGVNISENVDFQSKRTLFNE
ncbi:unnamed protein product [Heterobilharzia americana]|nr:unnamed protein product [Heterobilharzia americana]